MLLFNLQTETRNIKNLDQILSSLIGIYNNIKNLITTIMEQLLIMIAGFVIVLLLKC